MNKERAMELLNAIISSMSVENTHFDVIEYLLGVGFTKEELVDDFRFKNSDVEYVKESMDE